MKLSEYAKKHNIQYRAAWNRFKAGKIPNAKMIDGHVVIEEESPFNTKNVIIYARVSSSENKTNLEAQAERLCQYATAKGYTIVKVVKEVGSGVNDNRKQLQALLSSDEDWAIVIVEHKDRLTRVGSFVENPFIPVIGGIQPAVLNELYNQEKKDNGFMDRMLISYPDVTIPKYNDEEISTDAIIWYNSTITNLRKVIQKIKQQSDEEDFLKIEVCFSSDAKKIWIEKFNEITEKQNSDNENEYFKSMYPKQKSYIPRFAFLLNALNSVCNADIDFKIIEADAMKGAIKLSDYFVATAKKIKFEKSEDDKIDKLTKKANTIKDKVYEIWKVDKNFNRSKVAEKLNISRQSILNYIKNFENEQEKKDRKK